MIFYAILVVFIGCVIIYRFLTSNYYWKQDLGEARLWNRLSRREVVNFTSRRRQLGCLPPPFPNGWFMIIESKQLQVGRVKEIYALGVNLVAWRGVSGRAYVANAYCPHLGAHLGAGGTVSGECVTCPFHGWKFTGESGALVEIPYSNGRVPGGVGVKMRRTVETNNGFVYMWFHAENEEPHWWPQSLLESRSSLRYRGGLEFSIACHIQVCKQNTLGIPFYPISKFEG